MFGRHLVSARNDSEVKDENDPTRSPSGARRGRSMRPVATRLAGPPTAFSAGIDSCAKRAGSAPVPAGCRAGTRTVSGANGPYARLTTTHDDLGKVGTHSEEEN